MRLSRGDIIFTDMPCNPINPRQFMGRHFYIIVSTNNQYNNIQAVPLTSKTDKVKQGEFVIQFNCLNTPSKVLGNELSLFNKCFFTKGKWYGTATEKEMEQVNNCLKVQLGLSA